MKKLLGLLLGLLVILGIAGSASAVPFVEEYTGNKYLSEGEKIKFGFDMWYAPNDPPTDNVPNGFTLVSDAMGADLVEWAGVTAWVDIKAKDSRPEKPRVIISAFDDENNPSTIENWVQKIWLGSGNGFEHYRYLYDFSAAEVDIFEEWGWGKIVVKAANTANFVNDFRVLGAGLEVNPVPEPGTILLFSIGLLGIAGVSRKKE